MNPESSKHFFEQLPPLKQFEQVLELENYQELPSDWWLVVADIEGSTQAIAEGRYREINSLGGCTVAAVLNAVKPLKIPYVFGGDGASFCIPKGSLGAVRNALLGCQKLAAEDFQIKLRIGLVSYRQVQATAQVWVCRYQKSSDLEQAIFAGAGLMQAEELIKQQLGYQIQSHEGKADADFSGFECRWQQIPSPKEVTASLLVQATGQDMQEQFITYQALIDTMHQLLGNDDQQQPLSVEGIRLSFNRDELSSEARVRSHMQPEKGVTQQIWTLRLQNWIGTLLMGLGLRLGGADWGRYKSDAILNSDFRKFDGVFRSIFAANEKDLKEFKQWLERQHAEGVLYFGLHTSDAAQLTCLVSQTGVKHLHFVDGCDGGYALAAKDLKRQISQAV